MRTFVGTYRSKRCLKLAVNIDNTPTGTMTCNQCARVPALQSFVSATQKCPVVTPGQVPNANNVPKTRPNHSLSHEQALHKLGRLSKTVRHLRRKVVRGQERKRTLAAKEALRRDDMKKFCRELQFIAQRGTLEDKKVMWDYLQDVVRCEYLKAKRGPKGAQGMRWPRP